MPIIAVGTCGYSYKDWIGPVYPARTKAGDMLQLYARRFSTVEIDATYYRVPSAATFESMARRTPDGFRFAAKLPRTGTHVATSADRQIHADVPLLGRNIEPLISAGKFACVLMQFPNSFRPTSAARSHIGALRAALPDIALVAEFRHREWQTDDTLRLLTDLDIGLVNVDEPQFETLMRASSDVSSAIAYIRFHGRNSANWWRGTNESRYDYLYERAELEPWVERIVDLAASAGVREVLTYFNNHRRGQAVRNAELLETMIAARLPHDVQRAAVQRAEAQPLEEPLMLPLDFP